MIILDFIRSLRVIDFSIGFIIGISLALIFWS